MYRIAVIDGTVSWVQNKLGKATRVTKTEESE
jgi:hypothetical protein